MTEYYVDGDVGDDANAGTSAGSGNAWETLTHAAGQVAAGDKVWVKASADYTELLTLEASGSILSPIVWEGYTTTPGDGGQATIDGENTRAANVQLDGYDFNHFKNFILTGAQDFCVLIDTAHSSNSLWRNIRFTDGSGSPASVFGVTSGYSRILYHVLENIIIENMTAQGIAGLREDQVRIYDSIVRDNGGNGIELRTYSGGHAIERCLIHDNGGWGIRGDDAAVDQVSIRFNTIDGNADGGIDTRPQRRRSWTIMYNLITNHSGAGDIGLQSAGTTSGDVVFLVDGNFYWNNTTHKSGTFMDGDNDVTLTADPYTDSANDDYSLNNTAGGGAACRGAGPNNLDIGYHQHADVGGGHQVINGGVIGA